MDNQNVGQIVQPVPEINVPVVENKKTSYWMYSTLALAVALAGVLIWLKMSGPSQTFPVEWAGPTPVTTIIPTETPGETLPGQQCYTDSDCGVLAIKATTCCSCPEIVSKEMISNDGWEIYVSGKDYTSLKPAECQNFACQSCLLPEVLVCRRGLCTTNYAEVTPNVSDVLGQ